MDLGVDSASNFKNVLRTIIGLFPLVTSHAMDVYKADNIHSLMLTFYTIFATILSTFKAYKEVYADHKSIIQDLDKIIKLVESSEFFTMYKTEINNEINKKIEDLGKIEIIRFNTLKRDQKDYDKLAELTKISAIALDNIQDTNNTIEDIVFGNGSNSNVTDSDIEKELNKKIKDNLDKQQREFLLREKMKAIKESLSENDSEDDEDEEYLETLKDPILKNIYPESVVRLIKTENDKLKNMMSGSPDANITSTYINQLKKLP
ncbi:UNVERIFIED_CONTAM: hypothetical protein O8I53_11100 [Campylobacter lari]